MSIDDALRVRVGVTDLLTTYQYSQYWLDTRLSQAVNLTQKHQSSAAVEIGMRMIGRRCSGAVPAYRCTIRRRGLPARARHHLSSIYVEPLPDGSADLRMLQFIGTRPRSLGHLPRRRRAVQNGAEDGWRFARRRVITEGGLRRVRIWLLG